MSSSGRLLLLCSLCLLGQISAQNNYAGLLQSLLNENQDFLGVPATYPDDFELRIIYSQIDRNADGTVKLKTNEFNNSDSYFYPASTVKLPVALLALEWLNHQKIDSLSRNSPMIHGAMPGPYTARVADPTAISGWPSIAQDIKKIFLVSDNDAYNRLYELLGPKYINEKLLEKGFSETRIWHRLSVEGFDATHNQQLNPVMFLHNDSMIYSVPRRNSPYPSHTINLSPDHQIKGQAYITEGDSLVNEPFDFHLKNYSKLSDLHEIMISAVLASAQQEISQFNLSGEQRKFLMNSMSQLPRESQAPTFDTSYYDSYVKFFLFGDTKDSIPDHIKIFNKAGVAYGYLTDVAYIVDLKNNIDFILSASIHVNANGVYNDGKYEYDQIGIPFLARLGRVIYEYDLNRKRPHRANLTEILGLHHED